MCNNGMSCMHGCIQLCLILRILIRKKNNGSKALVSKWHPFIPVGHEQMAEFGGRGKCFQCSKLSKYKFFLLFAPKEKTLLCIILNRNTEVELLF